MFYWFSQTSRQCLKASWKASRIRVLNKEVKEHECEDPLDPQVLGISSYNSSEASDLKKEGIGLFFSIYIRRANMNYLNVIINKIV